MKNRWMSPTSCKVKSFPPVIFHTIPVALSIPISNKGDWIAFRAASLALDLPEKDKERKKLSTMKQFKDSNIHMSNQTLGHNN